MLRRNLGFTVAAVIALALEIGANTMIFTIIDNVLLRRLPYKDPAQLVLINETSSLLMLPKTPDSAPDFTDWAKQQQVFESIGAYISGKYNPTGRDLPQTLQGQRVSASLFGVLGVSPAFGRASLPKDYDSEKARVLIVSHGLSQRSLRSDTRALAMSRLELVLLPEKVIDTFSPFA